MINVNVFSFLQPHPTIHQSYFEFQTTKETACYFNSGTRITNNVLSIQYGVVIQYRYIVRNIELYIEISIQN